MPGQKVILQDDANSWVEAQIHSNMQQQEDEGRVKTCLLFQSKSPLGRSVLFAVAVAVLMCVPALQVVCGTAEAWQLSLKSLRTEKILAHGRRKALRW